MKTQNKTEDYGWVFPVIMIVTAILSYLIW